MIELLISFITAFIFYFFTIHIPQYIDDICLAIVLLHISWYFITEYKRTLTGILIIITILLLLVRLYSFIV